MAESAGRGSAFSIHILHPVVTSAIHCKNNLKPSVDITASRRDATALKVRTQPHMDIIPSLPDATDFISRLLLLIFWVKRGFFSTSVLLKKRVNIPMQRLDITDEAYRIIPLVVFFSINVPTAVITNAGPGFTHQLISFDASC